MFNHSSSNLHSYFADLEQVFRQLTAELEALAIEQEANNTVLVATNTSAEVTHVSSSETEVIDTALHIIKQATGKIQEFKDLNQNPLNLAYNLGLRYAEISAHYANEQDPCSDSKTRTPDLTTSLNGLLDLLLSPFASSERIEQYIKLEQDYHLGLIYYSCLQQLTKLLRSVNLDTADPTSSTVKLEQLTNLLTLSESALKTLKDLLEQTSLALLALVKEIKVTPSYSEQLEIEFSNFLRNFAKVFQKYSANHLCSLTTTTNAQSDLTSEQLIQLTQVDFRELAPIKPLYQAYLNELSKLELVSSSEEGGFEGKKRRLTVTFLEQIFAEIFTCSKFLKDRESTIKQTLTSLEHFEAVCYHQLKNLIDDSANQESLPQQIAKIVNWTADSYQLGEEESTYAHPSLQKLDLGRDPFTNSAVMVNAEFSSLKVVNAESNQSYWLKVAESNFSLKSWLDFQRIRKLYQGDWFFEKGNISLLELSITYFFSKVLCDLSAKLGLEPVGSQSSTLLTLMAMQLSTSLLPQQGLIPEAKELDQGLKLTSLAITQAPDYGYYGIANFEPGFVDLVLQAADLGIEPNVDLVRKYYLEEMHPARILKYGYWKEVYFHLNPATLIPRDTTASLIEKVAVAPEQEIQSYSKSFSFSVSYFSNYLIQRFASKPEQENFFFLTQEKLTKLSQLISNLKQQDVAPALQNFLCFVEQKFKVELAGATAKPLDFTQLEPYRLADLGTGSGILGIGLALELNHSLQLLGLSYPIKVVLSDLSLRALAASLANIKVAYQWLFGHNLADTEDFRLSPVSLNLYQESKEILASLPDLTAWYQQQEAKIARLEQLLAEQSCSTNEIPDKSSALLLASQISELYQELQQLLAQFNQELQTSQLWKQGFAQIEFELVWSSWLFNFSPEYLGKLDLVISNPPYIGSNFFYNSELAKNDPMRALSDFADGLSCYRDLLQQLKPFLKDDALVVLEFGFDQESQIKQLVATADYTEQPIWQAYLTALAKSSNESKTSLPRVSSLLEQYLSQAQDQGLLNKDSASNKDILANLAQPASYFAEEVYLFPTEYITQQLEQLLISSENKISDSNLSSQSRKELFAGNYSYQQSFFENQDSNLNTKFNHDSNTDLSEPSLNQAKPILLGGYLRFKRN